VNEKLPLASQNLSFLDLERERKEIINSQSNLEMLQTQFQKRKEKRKL
jgi:hypothetical protein